MQLLETPVAQAKRLPLPVTQKRRKTVIDFDSLALEMAAHAMQGWEYPKGREVSKADLRYVTDLLAYFRVSTDYQKKYGMGVRRQVDSLDDFMEDYEVKLNPLFVGWFDDSGRSAISAEHRMFGKLGLIIEMCGLQITSLKVGDTWNERHEENVQVVGKSLFRYGTPLFIEDLDRFSREVEEMAYAILCALVKYGGLIIVTDQHVWCRTSISTKGRELFDELKRSRREGRRLVKRANGWQMDFRIDMKNWKEGDPKPFVLTPAWCLRTGSKRNNDIDYVLLGGEKALSDRFISPARTIRKMFYLAVHKGMSRRLIAHWLNEHLDQYPVFGTKKCTTWTNAYVQKLMEDERVCGYRTLRTERDDGNVHPESPAPHTMSWYKRPTIAQARIFPIVIDRALFDKAQEAKHPGSHGPHTDYASNLFRGHIFCAECQQLATVVRVTSGSIVQFRLTCSTGREMGDRGCPAVRSHPFHLYERHVLNTILALLEKIPSPKKTDEMARAQIKDTEQTIARLEKRRKVLFDGDPAKFDRNTAKDYRAVNEQLSALQDKLAQLQRKLLAATNPSRNKEVNKFLREFVAKACFLDTEARKKLRDMLAPLNYRLVMDVDGTLHVTVGDSDPVPIKRPPPRRVYTRRERAPAHKVGIPGVYYDSNQGLYAVKFQGKTVARYRKLEDAIVRNNQLRSR